MATPLATRAVEPRASEPQLNRTDGHSERECNFLILQTVKLVKDQRRALIERQLDERGAHVGREALPIELHVRRRVSGGHRIPVSFRIRLERYLARNDHGAPTSDGGCAPG